MDPAILECLQNGDLNVEGQFMWGSNYTYLTAVEHGDQNFRAVYKPVRGERPLWDFPSHTLAGREVAAFLVSEAIGWDFVPPTVFRQDGPAGPGSLQYYVDHDVEYHYFNFKNEHRQRLRPVALFDALINNADRKGGHIIIDPQDKMWLIDHGICFHVHHKLRTVIWDFAGERLPEEACQDLSALRPRLEPEADLYLALQTYLREREISALASRADRLLSIGRFPKPPEDSRAYPWPAI